MLHQNMQEHTIACLKKHSKDGPILVKLNLSTQKGDKEDISLTNPIQKPMKKTLFTPALVVENKKTTCKDKLNILQNPLVGKSSQTLEADLTIIDQDFKKSLEKLLREVSLECTYPIPIVSQESLLTSLNGSLNILEQNLLLYPNPKCQKIPINLNLLKTSLESLHTIPLNFTEKENTLKLNPKTEPRQQTLKIRIYPNKDQKLKLGNYIDTYRLVYNTAISLIKEHKKTNFIFLREKVFEKINEKYNNPEWFNDLYFDSKTLAVKEASNAYISNYAKGGVFNVKYKSKHNKKQNLKIDHRVPKIKNDTLKMFKMDIYVRKFDMSKLKKIFEKNIISDSEIIREYPGKYFVILNYKTETPTVEKKIKRASIDPGIKTLTTVYTQEGIFFKLGNNIQKIYKNLSDRAKNLNEILPTKKGRTRKNIRKKLSKLRSKIRNVVENIHNMIGSFLARSTEELILPILDVSKMISKAKRNINKNIVKDIIYKSPYKLHQKIMDQCKKYNTKVTNIDESYTSVTCGNCLTRKLKSELLGSRIYDCNKCGMKIDRDYNGARNIMLKNDNMLV